MNRLVCSRFYSKAVHMSRAGMYYKLPTDPISTLPHQLVTECSHLPQDRLKPKTSAVLFWLDNKFTVLPVKLRTKDFLILTAGSVEESSL